MEEAAEQWDEHGVNEYGEKWRDDRPDGDSVPSGAPQKFDGAPQVGTRQGIDLGDCDRQVWSSKEFLAQAEERKDQRNLKGIHKIIHDLNGRKIQAPDEGDQRAERGGTSQSRKNSKDSAQGDAQRKLLGSNALFQKLEERLN